MAPAYAPTLIDPSSLRAVAGLRLLFAVVLVLACAAPTVGQEAVPPEVDDSVQVSSSADRPSPGGAFLRSVLVPGWGQAASGSYGRAAFYILAQAGNTWMTYKTEAMLNGSRRRQEVFEATAAGEFLRAGVHPDSVAAAVEGDPRVEDARELADARAEQKEDWVALLVFFTFLGGADAFVSAHLADFPVPLNVEPVVGIDGPAVEIGASIPWPARRSRKSARPTHR